MHTTLRALTLLGALAATACSSPEGRPEPSSSRPTERIDLLGDAWAGPAISYSGYRTGQSPDTGVRPSQEQVAEDLRLLARHWRLIRVYGADRHTEDVLEVIRREGLSLDVMLGIWLGREPGSESSNAHQVAEGIRLANAYEDVVVAVNVGNEVLIEWTAHPVPLDRVVGYVREVRAAVTQPVTVADNYVWWRDHGELLAREVDFITIHTYPLWERKDIDEGLSFTIDNYEGVRAAHPDRKIAIGEAGWASYTEGNLHVPRGGDEAKQQRYFRELTEWARSHGITVFFFEAFDEPWKGTGTEGHWGLFTVDREAKLAMRELFPDRISDGPTSPGYPEEVTAYGPDIAAVLHADLLAELLEGSVNPLGPGVVNADVVSEEGADGGTALRIAFDGSAWGGVYLILGEHDAGGAEAVTLRLRLPDAVARLELKLEAPAGEARSVDLLEHGSGRDADGWSTFTVPLTALDGIDRSRVAILGLWNPSDAGGQTVPGTLLVDAIRFD